MLSDVGLVMFDVFGVDCRFTVQCGLLMSGEM